jgi:hypothetical protein
MDAEMVLPIVAGDRCDNVVADRRWRKCQKHLAATGAGRKLLLLSNRTFC